MNTTTTRSALKRRTAGPLLIGATLVGILTLAGCTPDEPTPTSSPSTDASSPTPTPTPTDSTAPAPENADDAVDAGTAVVNEYLRIRGEVNAAGGTDTAPLESIATGPALTIATDDAGRIADEGSTTTGALEFEFQSGYATDLIAPDGTAYPFSSVTIIGCQDGSNYNITLADGTAAPRPQSRRAVIEFTTLWEPTLETWLVQNVTPTGSTC